MNEKEASRVNVLKYGFPETDVIKCVKAKVCKIQW